MLATRKLFLKMIDGTLMALNYQTLSFDSSEFLCRYVRDVYSLETTGQTVGQETSPINGAIGLSFCLSGYAEQEIEGGWSRLPEVTVLGLFETPQYFRTSQGYREVTIRFSPYQLQHFLAEDMVHLVGGKSVDATELFSKGELARLQEVLAGKPSPHELARSLHRFLGVNINEKKQNPRTEWAVRQIASGQVTSVQALADQLGVTSATLRNDFRTHVGVSPKTLIRMVRIYRVLCYGQGARSSNLTQLSLDMGYFDQAHLVHEFKKVLGVAPSKYFSNGTLVSDFRNFGRWINARIPTPSH